MKKLSIFIVAALAIFFSCSQMEEKENNPAPSLIEFVADIGNYQTKAQNTSFDEGDRIGIFAGYPVNAYNVPYGFKDGSFYSDSPIYWGEKQTEKSLFRMYYPYWVYADSEGIDIEVSPDQSDYSAYTHSDFMYASTESGPADGPVKFNVSHKLSKIYLSVTNLSDYGIKDVYFTDLYTAGRFSFEDESIKLTGEKSIVKACPAASVGGKYIWNLIVIPQTASPVLVMEMTNGEQIKYSLPSEFVFHSGKQSSADVKIGKSSTVISFFSEIKDWEDNDDMEFGKNGSLPSVESILSLTSQPDLIYFSGSRPDNFGFAMMDYSNDLEGADIVTPVSNFNWFSVCMEWTSRNPDYVNQYVRYYAPYIIISELNNIFKTFSGFGSIPEGYRTALGQAAALRACCYLRLAPYFQFNYSVAKDSPCVQILTENTVDEANNPRASVADVYDLILSDLDFAIENLQGFNRPDKTGIDVQVAYGLRARAYLNMGKYEEALQDALNAAKGYSPASYAEVSVPSFKSLDEHNWIWGYRLPYDYSWSFACPSSWIRSFSGQAYSCATGVYACCNTLLYNKIDDADIRKQWWVNEHLESSLLEGLAWPGFTDVAFADDGGNTKVPYLPYTNVKFGCNTIGGNQNTEDWPYMRVEEMILIQAECLAHTGRETEARQILEDFVNSYRYASGTTYNSSAGGRSLLDEIWFQRRVELWGEGFFMSDALRMQKPIVRFHNTTAESSNLDERYRFNIAYGDPVSLLGFPTAAKEKNPAITDNPAGSIPTPGQNGELRDGVTD